MVVDGLKLTIIFLFEFLASFLFSALLSFVIFLNSIGFEKSLRIVPTVFCLTALAISIPLTLLTLILFFKTARDMCCSAKAEPENQLFVKRTTGDS